MRQRLRQCGRDGDQCSRRHQPARCRSHTADGETSYERGGSGRCAARRRSPAPDSDSGRGSNPSGAWHERSRAATNAPAVGTNVATKADEEIFPPGLIKFQDADLIQVLDVYQELTGRTVLRPTSLPQTKVSIRSQDAAHAQGSHSGPRQHLVTEPDLMLPQGDKFVKANCLGAGWS